MNDWKRALGTITTAGAIATLVWGCGGSGPSVPPSAGGLGNGALKLVVMFPQPPQKPAAAGASRSTVSSTVASLSGAIHAPARSSAAPLTRATRATSGPTTGAGPGVPIGAQSVKVELIDPNTNTDLVQPQIVAPAASGQSISVSFPLLRAGPVHIVASAFADKNATPPALAVGSVDTTIASGATQQVTLQLTDTAADIGVASTSLSIDLNSGQTSTTNTATVFDSSEKTLTGLPLVWTSSDNTVAVVSYNPANPATVTIIGLRAGTSTIEVREPNTGLTTDATLTVTGQLGIHVTTLAVGNNPHGIAVNTTTNRIYVANHGSNSVTVIDGSSDTVVATVPVGAGPEGVAVDPVSNLIYVTNSGSNNVSLIDGSTNTVTATIAVGANPSGVSVNRASDITDIIVSNTADNTVSLISEVNNAVIATLPVGTAPLGVTSDPNTGKTFVANSGSNNVSVINIFGGNIEATVPVGLKPALLVADTVFGHIFVTNQDSGTVSEIDESTDGVALAGAVGTSPFGIDGSPSAGVGFVTDQATNIVYEFSLQAGLPLINAVELNSGAYEVAINTADSKLYITNGQTPGVVSILTTTGSMAR